MTDKGAILITGASTGIGRACVLRMDKLGYPVFAGVRKESDAQSLREAASDKLTPIMLDVTNAEQIAAAAKHIGDVLGDAPLMGLVNNAGIGVGGPLEFIPMEDLRWQYEVNVFGQVAVSQAMLPLMRRGDAGRIVNVGSIAGKVTTPFMGPYCSSKHALESISDALRMELRPWNIWCCVVEPGQIQTPIWDKAKESSSEMRNKLPAHAQALYEKGITAVEKAIHAGSKINVPAEKVAESVEHALVSKRPKTRYVVGTDASSANFLRWFLSDTAFEAVLRKVQGHP
ncbi:MAG TPA: SDR family oxidoreductase [Myxococcales bacterium]|nr:SDR family oxidoreductase [Myxococcales bacterium]